MTISITTTKATSFTMTITKLLQLMQIKTTSRVYKACRIAKIECTLGNRTISSIRGTSVSNSRNSIPKEDLLLLLLSSKMNQIFNSISSHHQCKILRIIIARRRTKLVTNKMQKMEQRRSDKWNGQIKFIIGRSRWLRGGVDLCQSF